jgi:hypothetical protein
MPDGAGRFDRAARDAGRGRQPAACACIAAADASPPIAHTTLSPMRRDVDLAHASRLVNHGQTVLVGSAHGGRRNLMAAAWSMPVEFTPEPHAQRAYDTFFGEVVAAQADARVFDGGRWTMSAGNAAVHTIHHLGAGRFVPAGPMLQANRLAPRGPAPRDEPRPRRRRWTSWCCAPTATARRR